MRTDDFDRIKPNSNNDKVRINDLIDIHKYTNNEYDQFRIISGYILITAVYWIEVHTQSGGTTRIPKNCLSFDYDDDNILKDVPDPYRDADCKLQKHYYLNVIMRKTQDNEPKNLKPWNKQERDTGFKDKDNGSWTPVVPLRISPMVMEKIQGFKKLNKHKIKDKETGQVMETTFHVFHPTMGRDILIKYDKNAAPANMYDVQLDSDKKRTPITDEEKKYLIWDLEAVHNKVNICESLDVANKEAKKLGLLSDDKLDGTNIVAGDAYYNVDGTGAGDNLPDVGGLPDETFYDDDSEPDTKIEDKNVVDAVDEVLFDENETAKKETTVDESFDKLEETPSEVAPVDEFDGLDAELSSDDIVDTDFDDLE